MDFSCAPTLLALCIYVFFLVLISIKRAYTLIWPLRHRVASFRGYIYSAIFVWAAVTTLRALTSLVVKFKILNIDSWMVALSCVVVFSLIVTCNFCYTREINR